MGAALPLAFATWGAVGWQTAVSLRAEADSCAGRGLYPRAVVAYRRAAAIYRRTGDPDAAKVLENQADRFDSSVILYVHRPAESAAVRKYYTGRRLEPIYGCYIGAFIDREDGLRGRYTDENGQVHGDSGEFNRLTGRNHATFFMYMQYGRRFPTRWTDHLRRNRAAAQLVLLPRSLDEVNDDPYLHAFARDAARSRTPIFLRFAGEMNGDWVPYHGDPARYIQKFRLVARVMHAEAPNVAMVWCPNEVPEKEIARYYPGEEAVDWVGVNFYSVLYNDNNRRRPAWFRNPADALRFIYSTYSRKHPIMIGEWAATHMGKADMRPRPDFAASKIAQLYAALPRLYPRVKAVHWFSMNCLKYAMAGRQLNNYSLLEDRQVAEQYARMVDSSYYLSMVRDGATAEVEVARLADGAALTGSVRLSAWARSYDESPRVVYRVGNRQMRVSSEAGGHEWDLNTRALPNGPVVVAATLLDSRGREAARQSVRVTIRN